MAWSQKFRLTPVIQPPTLLWNVLFCLLLLTSVVQNVCVCNMDFVSEDKTRLLLYVTVCEKVVPRLNKHDDVIEWNFMKIPTPRNGELFAPLTTTKLPGRSLVDFNAMASVFLYWVVISGVAERNTEVAQRSLGRKDTVCHSQESRERFYLYFTKLTQKHQVFGATSKVWERSCCFQESGRRYYPIFPRTIHERQ